jgi:hypothetical protein
MKEKERTKKGISPFSLARLIRRGRGFLAGILFVGWGSVFLAPPAHSAFKDPLWSARVAALGGAATALAGDPSAAFYNPATAVTMQDRATHFTYAKLFTGVDSVNLSLNELAYVQPLRGFNVLTAGWGSVIASDLYREDTLTVSGAHLFRELKGVGSLATGLSLRFLSQRYTLDQRSAGDAVFQEGKNRQDLAVDAHVYLPALPTLPGLSAGLSVRALNRPDVGFAEEDKLPTEVALGALYQWKNFRFPVDLVSRKSEQTPHFGVEALFVQKRLALRAGTDTHQIGTGVGYQYRLGGPISLSIDYTFLWPLELQNTSGSHRATVGLQF